MESQESLKVPMHSKLNEFSTLTRQLLESLLIDKPVSAGGVSTTTENVTSNTMSILERMVEGDKALQQLVDTAIEMRARQRKIDWVNTQLARRNMEIQDLQTKLHDAEKLLEFTVYHGHQKVESIKQAKEGAVDPTELIKYAHRISQASSAVSPVGWQPKRLVTLSLMEKPVLSDDPRRPFPQDIEMRSGALGQLKCVSVPIKEKVDTQLSQRVLAAGVNQNNNKASSIKQESIANVETRDHVDTMSEDSSFSSSDDEKH